MLARYLSLLLALEISAYAYLGILILPTAAAWPIALAVVCLLLGVRLVLVVASFVVARAHPGSLRPEAEIGPGRTAAVVLGEWVAFATAYVILQPLEPWLARRDMSVLEAPGTPVLLIHGVYCNSAVWVAVQRDLRRLGIRNVLAVKLEPVFGSIDEFANRLHAQIEEACALSGAARVRLVGHSLGGLVARAYLSKHGARRVTKLITIASPHHGSVHARYAHGAAARQMQPGSRWLADLNACEGESVFPPITSIYSWHDNLVVPPDSARLAGAKNLAVPALGHLAMLFSGRIHELLCQELCVAGE